MSEVTIARELRRAAKRLRADASWPAEDLHMALAEWLETEAHMCEHRGNSPEGQTFHALKVARACLAQAAVPEEGAPGQGRQQP